MSDKEKEKLIPDNSNNDNKEETKSSLDFKINNESVHNESVNINQNIGSFENDFDPNKDPISQIDDEILIEKSSNKLGSVREEDKRVDFEKFKKTKKRKHIFKPGNNGFSIKVDTWLRNDRTMQMVWLVASLIIGIVLAVAISFLTIICIEQSHAPNQGMWNLKSFRSIALANNIFTGMAIGIVVLPLFYLLITIMVGINDVYRSRQFHFFLWSCLILGLLFIIVSVPLGSYVMLWNAKFTPVPSSLTTI